MGVGLESLLAFVDSGGPGGVVGHYLYGSAVTGGLRPESDVDPLTVTRRSLSATERASLTGALLRLSDWGGNAEWCPAAEPDPYARDPRKGGVAWRRVLRGLPLAEAVPEATDEAVRQAMLDLVPQDLVGLDGDDDAGEARHALLTLARTLTTLEAGRIVAKDRAADHVLGLLPLKHRPTLTRARDAYLGRGRSTGRRRWARRGRWRGG